uniref:SAGA-associated factor 11 homolog n=1 Tax=Timema monikensis TaxID=170555 RepID=A0A7R9HT92_9NEOP|nr:unnamed protein product [Timema monikensis]
MLQYITAMNNPELANQISEFILENLIDELTLGIIFHVHLEVKKGYVDGIEVSDEFVEGTDMDIFSQQAPPKKTLECVCPSCKHSLAASRFAPHLAKCMGMGRNSSRIASRRIANNSKENVTYGGMMSDDDDDADWTAGTDRRRRKRERNGNRKPKIQKVSRNGDTMMVGVGDGVSVSTGPPAEQNANMSYDNMTHEEKKKLLTQICGVISEHTRKLCTRSMRCPQHSDEQRRLVRTTLLTQPESADLLHVDVDTYEEGDGQSMRESLGRSWEQERSNTSSPADSASTCSSSSKKRDKLPKTKNKNNKNHKGSPNLGGGSLPSLTD